ncbi:CopD family protein [Rhodopila sp.]|uniref:CopD family protein n=1 Tax=Rhodopila sp. TaxID=2480087 RepID=UPI003D13771D
MIGLAAITTLLRGLHLAACLSLLGGAGFIAWMLPAGVVPAAGVVAERLAPRLRLVCLVSGVVALLAGAAWFVLEAAAMAGADTLAGAIDVLPVVALHTRFGRVLMARLGLLLAAVVLVAVRPGTLLAPRPGTLEAANAPRQGAARGRLHGVIILTAVALSLEGLIGHAGATAGVVGEGLVLSETLHLVAAGIWLGALPSLWFSLRVLAPQAAAAVCERFSPIGLGCVVLLAGTGLAQGMQLIGSLPALFGTRYGHIALLKITLFLVALMLAAVNRLWLTDRLAADAPGAARRLRVSVLIETGIGVAIVAAAVFMAASPPADESTPVWPFAPGLITNPVLWRWVAVGAAPALLGAALLWRRWRPADDNHGGWHPHEPDQPSERRIK